MAIASPANKTIRGKHLAIFVGLVLRFPQTMEDPVLPVQVVRIDLLYTYIPVILGENTPTTDLLEMFTLLRGPGEKYTKFQVHLEKVGHKFTDQ